MISLNYPKVRNARARVRAPLFHLMYALNPNFSKTCMTGFSVLLIGLTLHLMNRIDNEYLKKYRAATRPYSNPKFCKVQRYFWLPWETV